MLTEQEVRKVIAGSSRGDWPADGPTADALLTAVKATTDALAALATARAKQASAFRDAHARGWGDAEIGRLTGVAQGTVGQQRKGSPRSRFQPAA